MSSVDQIIEVVSRLWPAAKVRPGDPVWVAALHDLAPEHLAAGVRALAVSTDRYAPKPGNVRALCKSAGPQALARPAPEPVRTDRWLAQNRCRALLAERLCGQSVGGETYAGDFDCLVVAHAVDLDIERRERMGRAQLLEHDRAAFRDLDAIFEAEWSRFAA